MIYTAITHTSAPGSKPGKDTFLIEGCGLEPHSDVSLLEGTSMVRIYSTLFVTHLVPGFGLALSLRHSIRKHAHTSSGHYK